MSTTITIDAAGRLVLPKRMRERLCLKAGSRLRVNLSGDRIELTPEPEESCALVVKGNTLVITGTTTTDSAAAVKAAREDRDSALSERTSRRRRK